MLVAAALLLFVIGIIHSYLGEKYLLIRLFRRDNLPKVMGSTRFTKQTLRFAWHLTTVAWWGFAAIILLLINPDEQTTDQILLIISATFAISGLISVVAARAKHLSWVCFFIIALLCFSYIY